VYLSETGKRFGKNQRKGQTIFLEGVISGLPVHIKERRMRKANRYFKRGGGRARKIAKILEEQFLRRRPKDKD
jgi:hypothetical protein